jgi:hypothetical protein
MRKLLLRGTPVALILGLAVHAWGQGAGDTKAIIEKAIAAQGGARNLEKMKAVRMQAKGTAYVMDMDFPFTIDASQQMPDKSRTVLKLTIMGNDVQIVEVLNGDKAWSQVAGTTKEAEAEDLAQMKFSQYTSRVQMLTPLLEDKQFTLTGLGESNINGKPAVGVKVAYPGQPDVKLYFDKDSSLLIKVTRPGREPINKGKVTQDEYYSAYKEFDGVKQPTKLLVNQDNKKFMEAEVTQLTFPGKFEDKVFTKPE